MNLTIINDFAHRVHLKRLARFVCLASGWHHRITPHLTTSHASRRVVITTNANVGSVHVLASVTAIVCPPAPAISRLLLITLVACIVIECLAETKRNIERAFHCYFRKLFET